MKSAIIKDGNKYRYFDMEGNELHEGDTIRYTSGREERLYLTINNLLGTDATNRKWIETGRALPCEYGIYPLEYSDVADCVKV